MTWPTKEQGDTRLRAIGARAICVRKTGDRKVTKLGTWTQVAGAWVIGSILGDNITAENFHLYEVSFDRGESWRSAGWVPELDEAAK